MDRASMFKKAGFYRKLEEDSLECLLCPHKCILKSNMTGKCIARRNISGELYSLNYGKISSISLDPIEKKPLKRFFPGSKILSVGSFGCNFKCEFCQNWSIAQKLPELMEAEPGQIVGKALERVCEGNIGIAYTYNEPSIWYEFVYETAKLANENGLKNVLVTNGFINKEPLEQILPYIDAVNIDLKAFRSSYYTDVCGGTLEGVKQTIKECYGRCHVEITTLVVPGLNDSEDEIRELANWISSISREIPLHLSRFFPRNRMTDIDATPMETLINLKRIAEEAIDVVYIGNV